MSFIHLHVFIPPPQLVLHYIVWPTVGCSNKKSSEYGHGKVHTEPKHTDRETKNDGAGYDDWLTTFVISHNSPEIAVRTKKKKMSLSPVAQIQWNIVTMMQSSPLNFAYNAHWVEIVVDEQYQAHCKTLIGVHEMHGRMEKKRDIFLLKSVAQT